MPSPPAIGLAYRVPLHGWTVEHGAAFDVLEVTLDHYFWGSERQRGRVEDLVGRFPLVAHGVGLSLGSDAPLDPAYLDQVAAAVDRLGMAYYSEHIAFTKLPGDADAATDGRARDLANLLPLPKTEATLEYLVRRIEEVQARIPVPLLLENITYYWDWADSRLDDAAWFNAIFEATGAGMLLDVENLWVNGRNHASLDPQAFLRALRPGTVKALHIAGGRTHSGGEYGEPVVAPVEVDTHDAPLRDGTLELLADVLALHPPETIIVERDKGFEDAAGRDSLLADVAAVRRIVARAIPDAAPHAAPDTTAARGPAPILHTNRSLGERQAAMLDHLLDPHAFGAGRRPGPPPPELSGIDAERLKVSGLFSMGKRQEKIRTILPLTWHALGGRPVYNFYDFCHRFPQTDPTKLTNARDFAAYLRDVWTAHPPEPTWLPDLLDFELAAATVASGAVPAPPSGEPVVGIRRSPGAVVVELDHDIRPLVDPTLPDAVPARRPVCLALVGGGAPGEPQGFRVFEIEPGIRDLLGALDDWHPREALDGLPPALLGQLAAAGLIEIAA